MVGRGREILFEFIRRGAYVKVTAIDAETNTEACIVGSPSVGQEALKSAARRKLEYVLRKRAEERRR